MKGPESQLWQRAEQRSQVLHYLVPDTPRQILKKSADTCEACGIWPFVTDDSDPFLPACAWHDRMYVKKERGELTPDWTRAKVDAYFYHQLNIVCINEQNYKKQTQLYALMALYVLVVNELGGMFW